MENLLHQLKSDFEFMLSLEREIGELNEKHKWYNTISDKKNFNPEMADKIRIKVDELYNKLFELKNKWGLITNYGNLPI